jgi:ribosomal protein S18 acetylase RimI-like enzyme
LIRECLVSDLKALEARMPTNGYRAHEQRFVSQEHGGSTYLVAVEHGVPVGACQIEWRSPTVARVRAAFPECRVISNLHVHPDTRGRGVGAALLAAAESLASARGHHTVGLAVDEGNAAAARLYTRLGYADTGIRYESRYLWRDATGSEVEVVEHDVFLIKHLDVKSGCGTGTR